MGFDARGLAARVVIAQPPSVPPRTHMLLLVQLDEEFWIADAGFGGPTLSAPIRLLADRAQQTPHGEYQCNRWARSGCSASDAAANGSRSTALTR